MRLARDIAGALEFAAPAGRHPPRPEAGQRLLIRSGRERAVLTDFGIAGARCRAMWRPPALKHDDRNAALPVARTGPGAPLSISAWTSMRWASRFYKAATGEVPFKLERDWFELARMHVEDPRPRSVAKRPELSKRFEARSFVKLPRQAPRRSLRQRRRAASRPR